MLTSAQIRSRVAELRSQRAEASAAQEPSSSEESAGQRAEATAAPQPSVPTTAALRRRLARDAWYSNSARGAREALSLMTDRAEATAAPLPSFSLRDLDGMLRDSLEPRLPQTLLPSPREMRLAEEPTDPPGWPPSRQRALFRGNRDRQTRQRAHARLQRDVVEAEMAYASWAATRSWLGRSAELLAEERRARAGPREEASSLAELLQQAVAAEFLQQPPPRPSRRERSAAYAELLQQAVAAELCDFLTRRPDFWEPDEPTRLALVLNRWARRSPPARLG